MQKKTLVIFSSIVFLLFVAGVIAVLFMNSRSTGTSVLPGGTGTYTGTMICLPHKNPGEFETLECAYGLKGDDGQNYGLADPDFKYLMSIGIGDKVLITGKFTAADDGLANYDVVGKITVESLEKK